MKQEERGGAVARTQSEGRRGLMGGVWRGKRRCKSADLGPAMLLRLQGDLQCVH